LNTVVDMWDLEWEEGGEVWLWRRPLRGWEEEWLVKCSNLLADFVLQSHVVDQWLWLYDPGGGYSVRGAYNLLTHRDGPEVLIITYLIWQKQVPLKVSWLAWRLLHNMLSTRDNLMRCHIISHDSQFCVTGFGAWKHRIMWIYVSIIICGGRAPLFVWVSANWCLDVITHGYCCCSAWLTLCWSGLAVSINKYHFRLVKK
jgi:hypothetical protein